MVINSRSVMQPSATRCGLSRHNLNDSSLLPFREITSNSCWQREEASRNRTAAGEVADFILNAQWCKSANRSGVLRRFARSAHGAPRFGSLSAQCVHIFSSSAKRKAQSSKILARSLPVPVCTPSATLVRDAARCQSTDSAAPQRKRSRPRVSESGSMSDGQRLQLPTNVWLAGRG